MTYDLLIDLHKDNPRQGPGSDEATLQALRLAGLMDASEYLRVADIGCGTGASTLMLAENLNAEITAVDLFQDFLDVLDAEAAKRGLADNITTLAGSMESLAFEDNSLDVIWAEGAIYNMGFEKGVACFRRFLKPEGILACSEITWLTKSRPEEIQKHWEAQYPEIAPASEKIRILEDHGFTLKGYFPLPQSCWIENYYAVLEGRFDDLVAKHESEAARALVEAEKAEIALYIKHHAHYSYGFYIARKACL